MVMTIYDSLWMEAPHGEESDVRHLMDQIMTPAASLFLICRSISKTEEIAHPILSHPD